MCWRRGASCNLQRSRTKQESTKVRGITWSPKKCSTQVLSGLQILPRLKEHSSKSSKSSTPPLTKIPSASWWPILSKMCPRSTTTYLLWTTLVWRVKLTKQLLHSQIRLFKLIKNYHLMQLHSPQLQLQYQCRQYKTSFKVLQSRNLILKISTSSKLHSKIKLKLNNPPMLTTIMSKNKIMHLKTSSITVVSITSNTSNETESTQDNKITIKIKTKINNLSNKAITTTISPIFHSNR